MRKRLGLICFTSLILLFTGVLNSQTEELPEWLKRVELTAQWESDNQPTFYFQTIQPLKFDEDGLDAFFFQPRISTRASETNYNLGTGYRKLVSDNLLLGINFFGDYESSREHGRVGAGLEALGQIWEARLNGYIGVTSKRLVDETSTTQSFEKVADGLDFEIGAPILYLPWLKIYSSGFWYAFDDLDSNFKDKYGWKTRMEAKLNGACRLELYTFNDNKGDQEIGGRLRFNLAFDSMKDIREAIFTLSDEPFTQHELKEDILLPVERSFDITLQRWTNSTTGSASYEIRRDN